MMHNSYPPRATIPPVTNDALRPLWSVMIPTYNCAHFLRETLASVLAQDPGQQMMQIEVVDDHSTEDDPAVVVAELGAGRVQFYRQPHNVGYINNFETCLRRARGHLIHLLHGDDVVRPGFYRKLQTPFAHHSEVGAAFCRHMLMDEQGHWERITWLEQPESGILPDWLPRIVREQRIQTPSIVVRREVYERLGAFDRRIMLCGEDWEMWIRIAAQYAVWYETEPLALYRLRRGSLSRHAARTAIDTRDLRTVLEIVEGYLPAFLPAEQAHALVEQARIEVARRALHKAQRMLTAHDAAAARAQVREALRCDHGTRTLARLVRLGLWVAARQLRRGLHATATHLQVKNT